MRVFIPLIMLASCNSPSSDEHISIYTLYRNSPYLEATGGNAIDPKMNRVHIATFDARGMDENYNKSHCHRVKQFYDDEWRNYYDEKPKDWARYWCEEGVYRSGN